MNPVYSLFATPRSLGPFFLRLAVAVVFFYHGAQKAFGWFGGDGWQRTIALWSQADGATLSGTWVGVMIVSELAIALGLALGFFTRLAGLGVCLLVGGSLFYAQGGAGFEGLEYPLTLLACGLALAAMGGGRFSIDRGISDNILPEFSR